MKLSAIARIIAIAEAVASNRGANTAELASQLEVTERTIQRDRDFLRDRLHLDLALTNDGNDWRWKASNVEAVLPLVKTLGRLT